MRYGNCFIGAIVLMWKERGNSPRFLYRRRPGTFVPHLMVRSDTGLHHYRTDRDLLPWPLCYLVFEGRFQTVQPGEEDEYDKPSMFSRNSGVS